jgi:hypothetical protein
MNARLAKAATIVRRFWVCSLLAVTAFGLCVVLIIFSIQLICLCHFANFFDHIGHAGQLGDQPMTSCSDGGL